ncbi:MAG: undecaprenyldiphospho-muramoylpentapeptide beta-N-acetylglucosaminyltransferase [Bacteroidales bacterium]|nr:undecaprenyldiphospho-muramoylpentapeptide beta-N-acetylglucosaminyltransferase [Bacteroidales bacterium]MDT8432509.1 undecaprenyldiphospho-muramoylpentapeptide beta-N-acetylglucosaminyltransferase [Bacteroidales bacterium]
MKETNKYRVIIGGGGTGGHIFPAISIANAIGNVLGDAVSFLFVGARGKIEMEKVPEAGYKITGLPVAGFQRKITWKNITFFFKLIRSMQLSRKLVRTFDPHLAIGVGGYASGPIVKAAARRKVPVVLQEQNSYAGVTNRILAKSAEQICVAYKGMERYFPAEKIILTGNPVRQDLLLPAEERDASFRHFGLDPSRRVMLLIGGSGGARTLNESVMEHIGEIDSSGAQLIWQSGKYYHEAARLSLQQSWAKNIVLLPFIREMNRAFQVADLVISRAGAGTISELCVIGKPVILVPSPNVAEDHQTRNARYLTDANAGILVHDRDARSELIGTAIQLLYDTQRKAELSENIKKLAIPDASERIAGIVTNLLKRA